MDINDLRSLFTVLVFVTFAGIVWWAYSSRQKTSFEEAARLPLEDGEEPFAVVQASADQRDN